MDKEWKATKGFGVKYYRWRHFVGQLAQIHTDRCRRLIGYDGSRNELPILLWVAVNATNFGLKWRWVKTWYHQRAMETTMVPNSSRPAKV